MKKEFSEVFLFDVPSLLPKFDLRKIDKKIKYLGLIFNFNIKKNEEKIFKEAKRYGFACLSIENMSSSIACANLTYNLNQIGEFVCIWTNNILMFQLAGPRTTIHFYKKNRLYDVELIRKEFEIDPWKIPDLFSFIGFKEKNIKKVLGIEKDKILKWIKYFSSAEELVNRFDLLELIEDKSTFHYQNLIRKQTNKILENLSKLKLEPSFLIPVKKEIFSIKKKAKLI